jgi:glyoxylase-like metal-dependent hydrolase (beta-lactamase superfamily II)
MEGSLHTLTGERLEQMTGLVQSLKANYKNLKADVTKTVDDGEVLPCGAEVVYTPGHTPGHICLYLKESHTLISGDALNVTNGLLLPAPERLSFDMEASKASLQKLTGFDIETVVCYHGGMYSENVNQRIKELAGLLTQQYPVSWAPQGVRGICKLHLSREGRKGVKAERLCEEGVTCLTSCRRLAL